MIKSMNSIITNNKEQRQKHAVQTCCVVWLMFLQFLLIWAFALFHVLKSSATFCSAFWQLPKILYKTTAKTILQDEVLKKYGNTLTDIIAEDVTRKSTVLSWTAFNFSAFAGVSPAAFCFSRASKSDRADRRAVPFFPIKLLHVSKSVSFTSKGIRPALIYNNKTVQLSLRAVLLIMDNTTNCHYLHNI